MDNFPKCTPQHKDIPILDRFHLVFSHEMLQIIIDMPTKQCELDPILTSLFKQLVPHIIDDVTAIINISLTRSGFTEEWKTAYIKLLIKRSLVSTSYRPVSTLKFLSKVVESCMLSQFNKHCTLHRLLPSYQSAYRANYSRENSLLKLCNNA